jgi:pimeloyl-ACP methyl ester carboxylesterase
VALNHHRTGSGETVVLLHGVGSQWQVWRPVIARLKALRDVVALDLPGFGESPSLPEGTEPTPQAMAAAVVATFDELGIERPLAAGNSLGGWVALEVARLGRARGVVPISPGGFQLPREKSYAGARLRMERDGAKLIAARAPQLPRVKAARTLLFSGMTAKPWAIPADEAVEMLENLAGSPGFDATLDSLARMTFAAGHEIDVPVTIVWGNRDLLLLPRQADRAVRVLPDARLVRLKGAGHVPTHDAPDEIARILLEA